MKLQLVRHIAISGAYALLPDRMQSREATVMLLAIGLQESRFRYRRQRHGSARGFWQFELAGVGGVLQHHASRPHALAVLDELDYPEYRDAVYEALEDNDVLAAAFARLLLYTDPAPLPLIGQAAKAWSYYTRTWRPGRPRPETWEHCYSQAVQQLETH